MKSMLSILAILMPVLAVCQDAVQCPYYTVGPDGNTFNYCGDETEPDMNIPGFPCGQYDMYVSVQFETDGAPYPIEVWSDANYVDFPNSPTNVPHIRIFSECNGQLLYSNSSGSCSIGSSISPPSPLGATEYELTLNLPAGIYVATIGYMNSTSLPFNTYFAQEGCISYTFGFTALLNGAEPPIELPNVEPTEWDYTPRYTKVAIESRGVFIRDGSTGQLYDVVTRRVIE